MYKVHQLLEFESYSCAQTQVSSLEQEHNDWAKPKNHWITEVKAPSGDHLE